MQNMHSNITQEDGTFKPLKSTTSITDLPQELLLIIFKFVYVFSRGLHEEEVIRSMIQAMRAEPMDTPSNTDQPSKISDYNDNDPLETIWCPWDDLRSPSLFPYALASVSNAWYALMLSVPQFWTRIVFLVDSNDFSLSSLHSHLAVSQDLLIDVTITRRDSDAFQGAQMEKLRLREIIDIVSPHIR